MWGNTLRGTNNTIGALQQLFIGSTSLMQPRVNGQCPQLSRSIEDGPWGAYGNGRFGRIVHRPEPS